MGQRSDRRATAWNYMETLSKCGLGKCLPVGKGKLRRKFVIDLNHPRASLLSDRPEADGFVRADENSLLFRKASSAVYDTIPRKLLTRKMKSDKGLEFRWTVLSDDDIRLLFECIRWLACTGSEPPMT